jgi:hypothetical protein
MFGIFPDKMEIKELRKTVGELQNSISILIGDAVEKTTNRGNPYRTYQAAISAIATKYEGTAEWGIQQVRNIIDIRSAFIIGQGIKLVCDDENSRELEFIEEFIKYNNLDEEMPQELSKEAEIEGRMLVRLIPNVDKTQIDMRFVSYSGNNYTIKTSEDDYQKYMSANYRTKSKDVILNENEFVYKKFAGRVDKVNEIMPKVAMVLRHCEDLDKALYDWRMANFYFSAPTPYFKCTTAQEVKEFSDKLKTANWKLGKLLVGTADFSMVEISGPGLNSLKEEIITLAKFISGATGVPVHFLGLPDLMSNRAVSTDLFEFINASTNKERHIWEGFYEELFDKVLTMANVSFKRGYETGKVKANILSITEAQVNQLVNVWLPLYVAGVVDLDYILSKIPDADKESILQSQNDSALKLLEGIKAQEKEIPAEEEGAMQ